MERPIEAELRDSPERLLHPRLGQDVEQLVPKARGRQIPDQPRLDRPARQRQRVAVHVEAQPCLVPDRSQEARRVLDEAQVVQHAHRLSIQVLEAAEEVVGGAEVLRPERRGHRIDGEVAPGEVVPQRRTLDLR